ncbi:hypothetical protein SAMN02746065_104112 [Desulfocicer vacuolatum DSM 3385]|uniref:Uncharacterized protein n=1 Tax=Desulfocicer vacuolatum DSM 3385 TaxID=1121400 RepID=A0A1W2A4J3_9BACT|nr:hypothetical protein [Desulfocicer vacuolatum]SMC55604.1 hypothetical protein SAMN02746065_104112 [Desulfocicer vacuolatum DSM 3385]
MGRFDDFELPVEKIQVYPLVFEAMVPPECSVFQDVRRYQSVTSNLDVRIIDINGKIPLEQGMTQIPMGSLPAGARREFIEYLKVRVTRGDNIGSLWAFFRSEDKKIITAYGANVVHKDSLQGQARAIALLKELQKGGPKTAFFIKLAVSIAVLALVFLGGYALYDKFFTGKSFDFSLGSSEPDSMEMAFYNELFPGVYSWLDSDKPDEKRIAQTFLKPEYVKDILSCMNQEAYRDISDSDVNFKGNRLALFVYFNYNRDVIKALRKYEMKLSGTEISRLARVYSCDKSGYTSNVFYFKVGDLNIKHPQVTQFLNENMISYTDYKRLRDSRQFSQMLKADTIDFKMKSFLADVYTFSPLKIEAPLDDIDWYLLIGRDSTDKVSFAAFFKRGESTLVPRRVAAALMGSGSTDTTYTWYAIDDDQQRKLKISNASAVYFTDKIGQSFKLGLIAAKIKNMQLSPIESDFPVVVHRELLMEDSKGKYGIQCYDPLTSLVLSNLINKASFEKSSHVTLKRDPIQVNTSLVQLSKDDSSSTQAVNISPGRSGIVKLFENADYFRGKLANGRVVKFERADVNLFNPFSFMVYNDSITFSYKHEINGMKFEIDRTKLGIIKSVDGGYQITEFD